MKHLLLTIPFFLGCDAALPYVDNLTCAYLPYYVADCSSPEVHDKAVSVLTNGAVEAQITCLGLALSPNNQKVVSLRYEASKLQDGSCFATVTAAVPGTTGFALENGSQLSGRFSPQSDNCLVPTFHGPLIRSNTFVQNGIVTFEGSACATSAGITCSMPVAGNCSGLEGNSF